MTSCGGVEDVRFRAALRQVVVHHEGIYSFRYTTQSTEKPPPATRIPLKDTLQTIFPDAKYWFLGMNYVFVLR